MIYIEYGIQEGTAVSKKWVILVYPEGRKNRQRLYNRVDFHWDKDGHYLADKLIFGWLTEHVLPKLKEKRGVIENR